MPPLNRIRSDEGSPVHHRYNTRSRSKTNFNHEPQMSSRHRNTQSSSSEASYSPCRRARPFYSQHLTIISVILVLVGVASLHSILAQDFDVKGHIHIIEKHLAEVITSLPVLRRIANNVQNNMQTCKITKDEQLRTVVQNAIEHYYADKTGIPDYALESAGGTVISTRETEPYNSGRNSLSLFGIPLCISNNNPNALIQPGVMPGECWAFKGHVGTTVIRLVTEIYVTGISVEHISPNISPRSETSTAPKEFSIWGLQTLDDTERFFFGNFKYDTNSAAVQYFPVKYKCLRTFDIIEFKVQSNHGHPEYTCIYRLRIHGDLGQK